MINNSPLKSGSVCPRVYSMFQLTATTPRVRNKAARNFRGVIFVLLQQNLMVSLYPKVL